jgi:hypothetical protein
MSSPTGKIPHEKRLFFREKISEKISIEKSGSDSRRNINTPWSYGLETTQPPTVSPVTNA